MAFEITETFYPEDCTEWRSWLQRHHDQRTEIWVVYYKKHTGKPTVAYQDAVDEALCFGWIDGFERRMDDERYAQRFTPRRKHSRWSENNVRRYQMLLERGLVAEAGKQAFEAKAQVYTPQMAKGGARWHESHKLPKSPTLEQRILWHQGHQANCACRPVPKYMAPYLELLVESPTPEESATS
jgi:hypothetical protein